MSVAATHARPERLPLLTCVGWGAGTLVTSVLLYASNTLLLRYLVDYVGIAAGTAGTLLAFSKVVDALVDPPIGVLTDRTRSRMGRRRPWLLAGTLLGVVSIVLMFSIPRLESAPLLLVYVGFILCLYAIAFSVFNIPYLAMPTEMTNRADDRSYLIQFRVYASAGASLLASSLAPALLQALGRTHAAHSVIGFALAPFILAGGLAAFFATRHAPATVAREHAPIRLAEQVRMLLGNRPAVALLACDLTRLIGITSQGVAAAFFTTYYLRASDYVLGMLLGTMTLAVIVTQPAWVAIGARTSKRVAYAIAATGASLVALSWLLAGPGEPASLIMLRAALNGAFQGGLFLMGNSMMPDAVEHDYHVSGYRREGNLVAVFTFCEQLAHAIAIAGVGWVLGAAGFVPKGGAGGAPQVAGVLDAIRMVYAIGPAVFVLLSATWLYWFNPILTGSRHARPH